MLGDDKDHGIRRVLNGTAPNPEIESSGIRDDLIEAAWGEGTAFPTALDELWPGRHFTRTDKGGATYVYGGPGVGWQSTVNPAAAQYQTIVGDAWDGISPLQYRIGSLAVQVSGTGSGNAPIPFAPAFPRGLLFASVQLVQSGAETVRVRWSADSPASTLGRLEVHLSGGSVPASSFHRLAYFIVGW